VRVGIIAREDADQTWETGRQRFPEDRERQLTHQLAIKLSDSAWHRQLSEPAEATASGDGRANALRRVLQGAATYRSPLRTCRWCWLSEPRSRGVVP